MLSDNFRGDGKHQRSNTNVHIFSRALVCGKCGSMFKAGLDTARKGGYRPSRYTCNSAKFVDNANGCSNYIGDITLLPFILNYIFNIVRLQSMIKPNHSLRDTERMLLKGGSFVDVECIDRKGLLSVWRICSYS